MTATTAKTLDELCVDTIRTLSIDAVQKANSGHPGAPMALAPLAYVLYTRILKHNPRNPDWPDRDRFVLSAGHASMLLYSTLYLAGYDISLEDIKQFRQLGSKTPGHPERHHAPGVEVTTGPLGQGISHAVGMALAERMLAARFNLAEHEVVDHRTFVIASDGDIQEGVCSEASSLAGHLGLGRLIVFFDNNHIQLSGPTSDAFSEDVALRYQAYGWHVQTVGDEEDGDLSLERLEQASRTAIAESERPSLILVRSHIGFGSPHKQDSPAAHGSPLGEEEVRLTKEAYGWDPDKDFYVPDEALKHFRDCVERGAGLESEWQSRFDAYAQEHPDLAGELQRMIRGELPPGWDADVPRFHASGTMTATRKSSHEALQWAASKVPELVGGSADLSSSTLDRIDDAAEVERGAYHGRNLHFGVREHAMGAIVNGLTLHYLRGYSSTFFNFSDYMRGSMRLAALMGLPSIFIFTHDSIGLGEDGPTHQPIEQLAGLRAEPTLRRGSSRRRERDGARLALRDRGPRPPHGACVLPPGHTDLEPLGGTRRCDRARGLCAAGLLQRARPAGSDLDLHGDRGAHLHAGRRPARGRRDRHARGQHALHGELLRAGAGVPRRRASSLGAGAGLARSREHVRLGALGGRTRGDDGDARIWCLGPGGGALRPFRLHARTGGGERPFGRRKGQGEITEHGH